jgi:hypothetical protein
MLAARGPRIDFCAELYPRDRNRVIPGAADIALMVFAINMDV